MNLLRECAVRIYTNIQGDSGGNDNILGGYNIGHCEKISLYEHLSNSG
jgi:hypothetical protein